MSNRQASVDQDATSTDTTGRANDDGNGRGGIFAALRARPRLRRALLVTAVVGLVAGAVAWYELHGRETTDDAQIDGTITPIAARTGGTVIAVEFADNQQVEAGQVLVRLDRADHRVALAKAEADLAAAKAALAAERSGLPITRETTASAVTTAEAGLQRARAAAAQAEAGLEAARAKLREAEATAARAVADLARLDGLIDKDEVSRQQYDAAATGAAAAKAAADAARASVTAAEHAAVQADTAVDGAAAQLRAARTAPDQVAVSQARVDAAAAKVAQAEAAVRRARLDLGYTTVTAPAAGVLSNRNVEVGQIIAPGQPLAALVNLGDVWVTANFKETQLEHMRAGQNAKIEVDATGQTLTGTVDSIAGATGARFSLLPPENASGNYVKVVQRLPVKIVLDPDQDPDRRLRPGMSVVPTVMIR